LQLSPPGYNIRSETLQHPSVRNAWLLAVHDPNQWIPSLGLNKWCSNLSHFYWNRFIFNRQGAKDKLAQFFEARCSCSSSCNSTVV